MWTFIWNILEWILRIWCKFSVYIYLFVCLSAYVCCESMSARGGWFVRAIMNICVFSLACLFQPASSSLPPSPPPYSSVVFEMLRGSLNSVSVSGWDAGTRNGPTAPRRAISVIHTSRSDHKYSFAAQRWKHQNVSSWIVQWGSRPSPLTFDPTDRFWWNFQGR